MKDLVKKAAFLQRKPSSQIKTSFLLEQEGKECSQKMLRESIFTTRQTTRAISSTESEVKLPRFGSWLYHLTSFCLSFSSLLNEDEKTVPTS
jgi:hypothetical protein